MELSAVSRGLCVPLQRDRTSTIGDRRLLVEDKDVTVKDVQLVGATEVTLIDAVLLPRIDDDTPIYVETGASYPPGGKFLTAAWRMRQQAVGSTLPARTEWGMSLGLEVGPEGGALDSVRVVYELSGEKYFQEVDAPVEIKAKCF